MMAKTLSSNTFTCVLVADVVVLVYAQYGVQ